MILLLHRKKSDAEPGRPEPAESDVDVIIGKNRNGPRGAVPFTYRGPLTQFRERAVTDM